MREEKGSATSEKAGENGTKPQGRKKVEQSGVEERTGKREKGRKGEGETPREKRDASSFFCGVYFYCALSRPPPPKKKSVDRRPPVSWRRFVCLFGYTRAFFAVADEDLFCRHRQNPRVYRDRECLEETAFDIKTEFLDLFGARHFKEHGGHPKRNGKASRGESQRDWSAETGWNDVCDDGRLSDLGRDGVKRMAWLEKLRDGGKDSG